MLWIILFKSASVWRSCSILWIECRTVVWCLPPNWRPISGKEAWVSSLPGTSRPAGDRRSAACSIFCFS